MQIFEVEDRIAKSLTYHMRARGDDAAFWRYVQNFADTVGFSIGGADDLATVELIDECARSYAYLRRSHPAYVERLTNGNAQRTAVLAAIVDWAVVKNVPTRHFAGPMSASLTASIESARDLAKASVDDSTEVTAEDIVPDVAAPSPEELDDEPYSHDELASFAVRHFEDKLSHVVRVGEYMDPYGYYRGSRRDEHGNLYDLAIVVPTRENDLTVYDFDAEGTATVRGTWNIKMVTGPLAGSPCVSHGPVFHADGSVTSDDLMLPGHACVDEIVHPLLSDADLAAAQWAELSALLGENVYVRSVTGYVGETDDQVHVQLDPPALATIDPITIDAYIGNHQIRDYEKGNDVVDVDVDITSDDPRLENYRSMFVGMASYFQDGRREPSEIYDGYVPELDAGVEPTAFVCR